MSIQVIDRAPINFDRAAVIARIKAALKKRSGRVWSVTGSTGTAYGWLVIQVPPAERTWEARVAGEDEKGYPVYEWDNTEAPGEGFMGPADCAELAKLLGLPKPVHFQGQSIPAGRDYYVEYIDRAEGRTPERFGTPYWD